MRQKKIIKRETDKLSTCFAFNQDDLKVFLGCWHGQLCRRSFHKCTSYWSFVVKTGTRYFPFLFLNWFFCCFLLQDSLFCVVTVFGGYYYWGNEGWMKANGLRCIDADGLILKYCNQCRNRWMKLTHKHFFVLCSSCWCKYCKRLRILFW